MKINVLNRNNRTSRHIVRQAVAAACLLPAVALAQDFTLDEPAETLPDEEAVRNLTEVRSEVEVGGLNVSEDSFRFGKYTGLKEKGFYGILNFDVNRRGPYDGESAEYWRLQGENLGLESRSADFEYGRQGDYKANIYYDQIPYYNTETTSTPFLGEGGTILTLPSNWVAGANTQGMTQLTPSLAQFDVETDRKRIGLGFQKLINSRWSASVGYQYETKQGTKTIGAVIGNTGGNPRSAILPEPVDYTEHKLNASIDYTTKKQQFSLAYNLSLFENGKNLLLWQNPYSAISGWDPSAGYPFGQGLLALPPDNQYNQIQATYGNNLSDRTRLVADVAYAVMTQDESFQQYTVNPILQSSIVNPLPRSSLDGEIRDLLLNLQIASRPTDKLHWTGKLRYQDRDNKTPRNAYDYIGGDSQRQVTALDGGRIRFNEPYSREDFQISLDGGYKIGQRTELSGGLEHRQTDRTRDKINLLVNYMPTEQWNIGFNANYINDDYTESEFGLTQTEIQEYTVDVAFMPTYDTSMYAFASLQKQDSDQDGRAFSGTAKLAQASDPNRNWFAKHRDEATSFGVGFKHTLIKDKLDIGADYVYVNTTGEVDVTTGSALTSAPLPDLKTKLHSLKVYGDYKIKRDTFLRLGYWYEKYDSEDWAFDGVSPNTLANVITTGQTSPDYDEHVIALSLVYRFD